MQAKKAGVHVIEVAYKAGVVDPVEETVLIGLRDLNIKGVKAVKTAKLYIIEGKLTAKQLENISSKLLVNPIIHHVITSGESVFTANPQYHFELKQIDLLKNEKAGMEEIRHNYTFSEIELNAVRDYYKNWAETRPMSNWKRWRRPGRSTACIRPLKPKLPMTVKLSTIS